MATNMVIDNYIGGCFVPARSGNTLDNVCPSTGMVYSTVPDSDEDDVNQAVAAAAEAFLQWQKTPTHIRAKMLRDIADRIDARADELAKAESEDQGKPIWLARSVDIPRAAANFRFFAGAVEHSGQDAHGVGDDGFNYTHRRPLGVAGLISPWNLPLYLLTWKIAPALATGNTAVCKPSELTPMSAFLLCQIFADAGLPAGVCNMVHGLGPKVGQALTSHAQVPLISFTGGTATAEHVIKDAAPHFKKLSLELGGKNPNVIFADADMDACIENTIRSSFLNQGEICLCGSRIFVERAAYESFKDRFVAAAAALKVGDPRDDDNFMGAVVSKGHQEKILSYIALAQEEGGTILTGGTAVQPEGRCAGGYFMRPTVIEGLNPQCRVMQEEIFGPVVTLTPFDHEDEVLAMANGTRYGLSATVWTADLKRAHRVSHALDVGQVWVNAWMKRDLRVPFGGVKASGVGREGGRHSLDFFTEAKNVYIDLGGSQ